MAIVAQPDTKVCCLWKDHAESIRPDRLAYRGHERNGNFCWHLDCGIYNIPQDGRIICLDTGEDISNLSRRNVRHANKVLRYRPVGMTNAATLNLFSRLRISKETAIFKRDNPMGILKALKEIRPVVR